MRTVERVLMLLDLYEKVLAVHKTCPAFFTHITHFIMNRIYDQVNHLYTIYPQLQAIVTQAKSQISAVRARYEPTKFILMDKRTARTYIEILIAERNNAAYVVKKEYETVIRKCVREFSYLGFRFCVLELEEWKLVAC